MSCTFIEYPAVIYKNGKNNVFVANCIMKKLIGYGKCEKDAITNLESVLSKLNAEYPVRVKPVYNFLSLAE